MADPVDLVMVEVLDRLAVEDEAAKRIRDGEGVTPPPVTAFEASLEVHAPISFGGEAARNGQEACA